MYRRLQYLALFLIWFPLRNVLRFFSSRRHAYHVLPRVGDQLGNILYCLFLPGRRLVRAELESLGLGRPGAVRRTFQHLMKTTLEGMVFEDLNRDLIEETTVFRGREHLEAGLARGRGVLLCLFHFGWHMHVIPALGYTGCPVVQVADPAPVDLERNFGYLRRRVTEQRLKNASRLPAVFLRTGTYLRPFLRALGENSAIIAALDGRGGKVFRSYDFLGRRILISPVLIRAAQRHGSPVIPLFTYRGEDGRHRIIFHPPLSGDDPDGAVAEILSLFAVHLQRRPEQYGHYLLSNALGLGRKEQGISPLFEI